MPRWPICGATMAGPPGVNAKLAVVPMKPGKTEPGKAELGKAELGKAELGKAELGKTELGKMAA